jgi:hypothetical protein
LQCKNCGDVVDPRRVELGYDYCLKEECQQVCLERVELAAIGVNKAADYYMKAEELLPPRPPAVRTRSTTSGPPGTSAARALDAEEPEEIRPPRPRPTTTPRRPKTTLERLREHEVALDEALDRSYERFRSGEITAVDMHRERDQMVDAFNRMVKRENIRYRSMLRGPAHRAG